VTRIEKNTAKIEN